MYKKLLSYALILSLIAPDIGRCMESDGPLIQRRQSLPSQLKKSFPETSKTRSRSFGDANRELILLMPQFHRSVISPQKFPLIEQKSEEQQQNHQDFNSPLDLTKLVQECLVEEKGPGAVLQPLLQEHDQENSTMEPNIVLPGTKLEKSPPEEKNEGDHSQSPPSDYTHSSPSSSPTKNSPNHSGETEESEVTLTHSSSFDSPRDDNLTQKKDDKDLVPTLIDNKSQQKVMDVNSSQTYSSNPVLILPEEPLTQPSTDVHTSPQKVEQKIESSPTSMDQQKQSIPTINNDEMPNVSEKSKIIVRTSETDLSESLSSTDTSPREQESISRRSSMDSSDSDSQQEMNTQGTSLAEATLLQQLPTQGKPQRKLSDSSSRNESLQNLKGDEASSPKTLNSSQNSLEKQEQKQTSESGEERPYFNFIGTWKKDYKEGKKIHLRNNSERVGNIQDGGSRDIDPELSSNVKDIREGNVPDEKTRLFPGKRLPLELSEKNSGLKENWQKVGSDSDSLQFTNEQGDPNFSDGGIKIGIQNGKGQRLVQEIGDGWVDLGFKGNSKGIFELRPFNGDGERPQPFSINGEPNDSQLEKSLAKSRGYTALDGDDPEGGNGGHLISIGEDDISPAMRAFLLHAHYLIEGKPSRRQIWMGGIGGTLIGVGVGNAMPPIFFQSLKDLGPTYFDMLKNNDLAENLFTAHTAISLGIDSISRNVHILGELASPSMEEFSIPKNKRLKDIRLGLLILTYGGAGLAALLPVYYLWESQNEYRKHHPDDKGTAVFVGCLAGSLWTDSLLMIGCAIKNRIDATFNNLNIRQTYANRFSPAYDLHEQELHCFQDLTSIFREMDDREIHTAYTRLSFSNEYTQNLAAEQDKLNAEYTKMSYWQQFKGVFSDQDTLNIKQIKENINQIKINESIRLLRILQQIHKENNSIHNSSPMNELTENWRTSTATLTGWGLPLIASVGRSLVFWYVIDDMLGSVGLAYGALRTGLSIGLGEITAATFQGVVEIDTVKKAASDLLFATEEGDSSRNPLWTTLRRMGKGYTYLQGAWNTLPYMLVGGKATRFWPTWTRVVTLLPFGLADMGNNSEYLQESYGDVLWAVESVAAHYGKTTPGYMRNRLIELAEKFHDLYGPIHPDVLKKSATLFSTDVKIINDLSSDSSSDTQ